MAEPTAVQRRGLARLGLAMPDGSYYIRNGKVGASDLDNAILAVGRGQEDSHNAIRMHVTKRANALGLSDKIPDDWQADGSLKHDELYQQADDFLEHFGIVGMRWGHHLPGVEVLGGSGNGDSKPSPFIQRGDHTGNKPGDSGPPGQDVKSPEQQAGHSLDALAALRDRVAQATESARSEAENAFHVPEHAPAQSPSQQPSQSPPSKPASQAPAKAPAKTAAKPKSKLTKNQATAVHAASRKHLAHVTQLHNKAKNSTAAHKAHLAQLAKHHNKAQAAKAKHAAQKLHAAHMNHLHQVAQNAHAVHQAHVAKLKKVSPHSQANSSHLNAQDKAALSKLSTTQRSALKKLTPEQRSSLSKMTVAQRAKLTHLTPAERTAISHLSPKQKAALAKATAASAKKRHETALAKKANTSPAAARKITAAAQAKRTPAQKAAIAKLAANAQNGMLRLSMDDQIGTFLEHHGIKGMKWGVRRNGGHPGAVRAQVHINSSVDHQNAALIRAKARSQGGVHSLTNDEIRILTDRLSLEANYHRQHPQTGKLDKGRKFVKTVTGDAKTVLDAVDTGRRVVKLAQDTQASASSHQRRRNRNAPLRVVSVK